MSENVACRNCAETDYGLFCQAALGGTCPDRVELAVPGLMSAPSRLPVEEPEG